MTADAFGPSCVLDPPPKGLLPLAALFWRYGPGVAPDCVNGLALEFLQHAALIGEERIGRPPPGRIGQAVRREAKRLLKVPDALLLNAVRSASDELRSEFRVRYYYPGGAPVQAAREALQLVSERGAEGGERSPSDPRGVPWTLKGRPEYPGVDDLLDRLAANYFELMGRNPTASQERVDEMGFLDFCKEVDRLAAAPEGIADENRIRRAVGRWRGDSSVREKAFARRKAPLD